MTSFASAALGASAWRASAATGAPAYEALHTVLSGLKCNDPLRTVTILVPNQKFGVAVRRFLARGIDGRAGVAGLSVLTVDRLAEQVATPTLVGSGRRPATDAVIAAAWRRALDEEPGSFALVATHPATVRALAAAHRELQEIDDAAHDAIAQCGNPVTADLVRLHRRVVQVLAGSWYDVTDPAPRQRRR
ncbi:MAG: ATP-dependent helicase/nuclease subunit [Actinoplanes sp.]|nr:ATP-dependent helicase/nuclease subunit [Actinoplanes sp.]